MKMTTRKTRICSLDSLDEELKSAIHAHALKHGLKDLESNVLMCCETLSVRQKKGFWGGIQTTLSAAYVTPKWLVWARRSIKLNLLRKLCGFSTAWI